MPKASVSSTDTRQVLATLNRALKQVDPRLRQQLRLSHFESVCIEDYQGILDVESFAINAGYNELK